MSSLSARDKPSSSVRVERLKCIICGKVQHNNETVKYRMEESETTTILLKAASHLMDKVFTRVADLQDVFAADIRYHSVCLELYLRRYERSLNDSSPLPRVSKKRATFQTEIERMKFILDQGNGLTLSEIRDIINK